jgi:hypothetical protein
MQPAVGCEDPRASPRCISTNIQQATLGEASPARGRSEDSELVHRRFLDHSHEWAERLVAFQAPSLRDLLSRGLRKNETTPIET